MADYYRRTGRLVAVNGDLPMDEVTEQIFRILEDHHAVAIIRHNVLIGMAIVCKSAAEIEQMRQSGHIVRQVLDHVRSLVAPGVTTMDLERAAEKKIAELGAKPAFKGYYDYPCVLCTSVNEEIVHGIPSEKRDAERRRHRFHRLRSGARRLLRRRSDHGAGRRSGEAGVAEAADSDRRVALRGIEQVRIGNSVGDVGAAVQEHVEAPVSAWCASS